MKTIPTHHEPPLLFHNPSSLLPRLSIIFYLLFSIFYLLSTNTTGQTYQNICPPGITFYKNDNNSFKAFRRDSIQLPGNNDTVFYSYRTIYPDYNWPNCFDTTNGSILGFKVYKKNDGTFYFFNKSHDTLTILTQSTLNQTWKFCRLTGTDKIEAKLTSYEMDSVFGTLEQVKVITLQAKNGSGTNINHYLNGRTIKISQHHGFFKIPNFYYTPDNQTTDTANYFLVGMTYTNQGFQNLTWQQVFNFEVGDEFHFQGQYQAGPFWKTMKQVLSKTTSSNSDTVTYTIKYCKAMWVPQPPPNVVYTYDTITETYPNEYFDDAVAVSSLPNQFIPTSDPWSPSAAYYDRLINFTGKYTQKFDSWQYVCDPSTHCWGFPFEGGMFQLDYSEGLGVTRSESQQIDIGIVWWWENLVYYKKGNLVWGTPVATDCNTLVGLAPPEPAHSVSINVVPNPVEGQSEIFIQNAQSGRYDYILYDFKGEAVLSGEVKSGWIIDHSLVKPGIYLLRIAHEDGDHAATKRIIFR